MQLEFYKFVNILAAVLTIAAFGTFVSQLRKIVGLKFYSVKLFVATKLFDFGFGILLTQHYIAVFISGEFIEELLLGDA